MKRKLVKDWMTLEVVTISPYTTWLEADRIMTENRIRRLPVVDHGRLVGIVTRGDVRSAQPSNMLPRTIWALSYMLSELGIEEIMTPHPLTISPQATLAEAAQIMLEKKISGLPVVDADGQVVGIITESDIFRLMVKASPKIERLAVG